MDGCSDGGADDRDFAEAAVVAVSFVNLTFCFGGGVARFGAFGWGEDWGVGGDLTGGVVGGLLAPD